MTIGLGSGRAVFAVIELAAQRWPAGPPPLCVAASSETERRARAAGFTLVSLDELDRRRAGREGGVTPAGGCSTWVVDGADEVDPRLDLLKGGGGALLREKLVARAAAFLLIVVEEDKLVAQLGERHALPVEIVRFGWRETRRKLLELVASASLRRGADGRAFVTDEGHFIVDCELGQGGGEGLPALAAALKALPGVVEHGLFLGMADEVIVGHADGGVERRGEGRIDYLSPRPRSRPRAYNRFLDTVSFSPSRSHVAPRVHQAVAPRVPFWPFWPLPCRLRCSCRDATPLPRASGRCCTCCSWCSWPAPAAPARRSWRRSWPSLPGTSSFCRPITH